MGKQRKLTPGEIALARTAFGDRIQYAKVKLSDGPGNNVFAHIAFGKGNPAITIGSTVYFKLDYCPDFSAPGRNGATFMHEMAHVWQYRTLGVPAFAARYGAEFLKVKGKPNAMYQYTEGESKFAEAMLEAQAQMVGDYYEAKAQGNASRTARLARNLAGSGLYEL
ncbi:MAG TPA: hypothetical protein VEA61_11665 [Allosphingosinicella sp.]|nr:hypothetical protein [Allosphingosinicella sp.]